MVDPTSAGDGWRDYRGGRARSSCSIRATARCAATLRRFPFDDCKVGGAFLACIVQQGTTDADGVLALRGPRGPLALRVGGGLALQIVQPIRLDETGRAARGRETRSPVAGKLVPEAGSPRAVGARSAAAQLETDKIGIEPAFERMARRCIATSRHRSHSRPTAASRSMAFPRGSGTCWWVARQRFAATTITFTEGQQPRAGCRRVGDGDCRRHAAYPHQWRTRSRELRQRHRSHAIARSATRLGSQSMGRADEAGCSRLVTCVGSLQVQVSWESATGAGERCGRRPWSRARVARSRARPARRRTGPHRSDAGRRTGRRAACAVQRR